MSSVRTVTTSVRGPVEIVTAVFPGIRVESNRRDATAPGHRQAAEAELADFGDGAAAVVLQASEADEGLQLEKLGCYGEAREILRIHGMGGAYVNKGRLLGDTDWQFEGQEIFKKAVTGMGHACEDVLTRARLKPDDIDLVVPHQANLRIIEFVAKRAGVPMDRVYVNVQQFNKEFLEENFKTTKGARWKVTGSPMGRGGLEYLGEDVERYKRILDIFQRHRGGRSVIKMKDLAEKVRNMPPVKAQEMMQSWRDFDIIDVMRQMDKDAEVEGTSSIVPYLLTLFQPDRRAEITRKMMLPALTRADAAEDDDEVADKP